MDLGSTPHGGTKSAPSTPLWRTACFFGSFDPVVIGHLEIMDFVFTRNLASHVNVLVRRNPKKQHLLSRENAVRLFHFSLPQEQRPQVSFTVSEFPYTLAPAGTDVFIRGVRDTADVDYERKVRRNAHIGALLQWRRPLPFVTFRSSRPLRKISSSTSARRILADPGAGLQDLLSCVPPSVADILFDAKRHAARQTAPDLYRVEFDSEVGRLLDQVERHAPRRDAAIGLA